MNSPVSDWENRMVNGEALMADPVFRMDRAKVDELRAQQARYEASLPTSIEEIITAAKASLNDGYDDYPPGFEEALFLSLALRPMIAALDTDMPGRDRDAILWIAGRVEDGLWQTKQRLDHANNILGNHNRIKREGGAG